MKIFNESTNKIETFKTIKENEVKMYVCGPTIYSDIHIGNARPIIFFDIVNRFLTKKGYNVLYVSNITDVDDKIINRALAEGISEVELVNRYKRAYKEVLKELNIVEYYKQPLVTEFIGEIINFIKKLVDTGFAYVVDGDVYFDVTKVSDYGEISNVDLEALMPGTRIDVNEAKQYDNDFVLWKQTEIGVNWDSPWSKGRPGWHTECVVMIDSILGNNIDIHGGGMDLKFPHHENENAQARACGNKLANYWMHNGFINIDSEKMSKSIGNVILVKDFINEYSPRILRLVMCQTNYRQPINLTTNFLEQTAKMDEKFANVYKKMHVEYTNTFEDNSFIDEIKAQMENDFNVANVITLLLNLTKGDMNDLKSDALNYGFEILGLVYNNEAVEIPKAVQVLIEERQNAKRDKDFARADYLRTEINSLGYEILDTRQGVECQKIKK